MRLEPGDEQVELVAVVRSVLDDVVTPAARRQRHDGGPLDRGAWRTLGELGVFGILVPDADGGLGLGVVELCLVLEEVGRSGLSAPVLEASTVVAPLLAAVTDDRRDYLASLLEGGTVATATLVPGAGLATDALDADIVATLGDAVHVDLASRFRRRAQIGLDSARRVGAVEPTHARCVVLGEADRSLLDSRVIVANSALLLGIATTLADRTVTYATERYQFGRPIGSFQALKHLLADVHVELEASRAAVWSAAVQLDEDAGAGARCAAHVAAAMTGEAARLANEVALQIHGGIGYTWEHDLQTWLKQGIVVGRRIGRPALHARAAARLAGVLDAAVGSSGPDQAPRHDAPLEVVT